MGDKTSEFAIMSAAAIGLVSLGITSVIGLAILSGVKTAGTDVSNATIALFETGVAVFGTFATVIALVLVGKVIIGLIKKGM